MSSPASWVESCEAALRGEAVDGVESVPHGSPRVLDADAQRALLAPFIAAFLWAAVVWREQQHHPLEPIALVLRLLALALSVRALIALFSIAQRLATAARRRRYGLALADGGLLYRTPDADYAITKQDVVGVREPGSWGERSGARWSPVYVTTRPSAGRIYLALPPLLDATPGILAERLMRWRGVITQAPDAAPAAPAELPSKLFDACARGEAPAGVIAVPLGRPWLVRAPYATLLLGVVLLEGYLRLPPPFRQHLGSVTPMVIALCLGVVPLAWGVLARVDAAPRKGSALLLTRAELLLRTRAGVTRVPHTQIASIEILSRRGWSLVRGSYAARTLVIARKDAGALHFAEALLGLPVEVVAMLCEGAKKGLLP